MAENIVITIEEVSNNINITVEDITTDINITMESAVPTNWGTIGGIISNQEDLISLLEDYVIDSNYIHTDNNYSDTEKAKLEGIASGAEVNVNADWNAISGDAQILNKPIIPTQYTDSMARASISKTVVGLDYSNTTGILSLTNGYTIPTLVDFNNKVDKETGKGLSENDFTDAYKTKIDGIESGAEVNTVNSVNGQTGDVNLEIPDQLSDLADDSTHRTVTDSEKNAWNNKQDAGDYATNTALATKEPSLPSTPTNPETKYLNANKEWADISIGNGGYSANVYYTTTSSDIGGYYKISYNLPAGETELSATITNGEYLVRTYLYDSELGVTTIDAGMWVFSSTIKVSPSAGETQLKAEIFLRHTDNTETTLFSGYSPIINNTDYAVVKAEVNEGAVTCLATDRLGVRVYAKTTSNSNIIINTIVGDGRASYFTTPLRLRHNQLRDLNGDNNYLHITAIKQSNYDTAYTNTHTHDNKSILDATTASFTDVNYIHTDNNFTTTLKTSYDNAVDLSHSHSNKSILDNTTASFTTAQESNLANQSGVNTGDETASTIKDKLGIATLSGANTGDQDLSNYATIEDINKLKSLSVAMSIALG